MSGQIGICLERPSGPDRAAGRPLWGDIGQVLIRTFAHFGVDVLKDCVITYAVPDPSQTGDRIALVRPQVERLQNELAACSKILACGAMSMAAVLPMQQVPTKYHRVRGQGLMTEWGSPKKYVVPSYSIQQVWSAPDYARDLYLDVQKVIVQDVPHPEPHIETIVVQSVDEAHAWLKKLCAATIIGADTETDGTDHLRHKLSSIGFAAMSRDNGLCGTAIIIPRHLLYPKNQYLCGLLLQFLGPRSPFKGTVVWQNFPFDAVMLREYLDDWPFHPSTADTLIMNYACDERPIGRYGIHSLKDMARIRFDCNYGFDWATFLPLPEEERPYDDLYRYNGLDCFYTARLYEIIREEMSLEPGLNELVENLLIPASKALAKVAYKGILVDQYYLQKYRQKLDVLVGERELAMQEFASQQGVNDFIPSSPQQVAKFLFNTLGLTMPNVKMKDKKIGSWSTAKMVLDKMRPAASEEQRTFIDNLLAYRLYDKTRSTYVDSLLEKVSLDGRIHPNLALAGTATGRLACVAKGTLVEIVRDVSVYPKGVPIEEVRAGDIAYTYDNDRCLTLRRVLRCERTGHRSVLRLHWAGDGHHHNGYVDVTPDHHVRLVDGTYRPAAALRVGDRVLALSRGVDGGGYARLWATGHEEITKEHRFILETLTGIVPNQTHHRDGNKLNNLLDNIIPITAEEHARLHNTGKELSNETRAKLSYAMRNNWANGVYDEHTGPQAWNYLGLERSWMERVLWENSGKPTAFRDIYGIDYETALKYLSLHAIDWKSIRSCFTADGTLITRDFVEEGRRIYTVEGQRPALAFMGMNYYRFRTVQEHHGFPPFNHRITAIESLPGLVDVYDIEIDGTHNFIAGEICVHNSFNPNMQNQPVHTAKDLRRAFIAPPGYTLIEADHKNLELRVAAYFSGEPVLVEAFRNDADLHRATAAKVFNKRYEDVTDHERFLAKAVNFGLIFGRSAEALAEGREMDEYEARGGTRWTLEVARQFHDDYMNSMPVLKEWIRQHVAKTFETKMTVTPYGRRRRFPLITSYMRGEVERRAVNTVIQSTASDITLEGLVRLVDALPDGAWVILTVHDSILVECRDDLVPRVSALMRTIMEQPSLPDRGVPWRVDIHTAKNWADIKD